MYNFYLPDFFDELLPALPPRQERRRGQGGPTPLFQYAKDLTTPTSIRSHPPAD